METLTESLAIEYLRRAVAEYGAEYVDPNAADGELCQNVYRNDAGEVAGRCIAAQVLSYHGIDDETLQGYNDYAIDNVIEKLELSVEAGAEMVLSKAQTWQDRGEPWGTIVQDLCEEAVD